jgi:hypothetical protein
MICYARSGLAKDFYIVQKEEFSMKSCVCDTNTWQRSSLLIRDKPILSSEMMLDKDYDSKGSVAKKSGRDPQGAWCQDEMIGGKPTVVK